MLLLLLLLLLLPACEPGFDGRVRCDGSLCNLGETCRRFCSNGGGRECSPLAAEGETCRATSDENECIYKHRCRDDLECADQGVSDVGTISLCTVPARVGEACFATSGPDGCEDPLVCRIDDASDGFSGTCQAAATRGATCNRFLDEDVVLHDCEPGLACTDVVTIEGGEETRCE